LIIDSIFLLIAIFLTIFIWKKSREFRRFSRFTVLFVVLGALAMLYLIVISLLIHSFLFLIPLFLLGVFLLSWKREKRRVVNGFFFGVFFSSLPLYLLYLRVADPEQTSRNFLISLGIGIGFVLMVLVLLFGLIALIMFLFANAFVVRKRENARLSNMLTLLIGIGLVVFTFLQYILIPFLQYNNVLWTQAEMPLILRIFTASAPFILAYYFLLFASFLLSSVLYNMDKPKFDKDFVVVLGAGLLEGRSVTPLLKQRIQCGIDFANKQKEVTSKLPKLIMSGGQGADELVSEAFAMKEAAVELGFPDNEILLEDQSTTTFENMKFSKALMEDVTIDQKFKVVISTNNYHLFRAAIYSRIAGLDADGIGSKTAKYFVPNAFLREFVAQVLMNKKTHLIITALLFFVTLAVQVLGQLIIQ